MSDQVLNETRKPLDGDRVDDLDRPYDTSTGTAPENQEHGREAVGAGAGALGGAAVGMAVGGPPGAVIGGAAIVGSRNGGPRWRGNQCRGDRSCALGHEMSPGHDWCSRWRSLIAHQFS